MVKTKLRIRLCLEQTSSLTMNYIKQINAFWRTYSENQIKSPVAAGLYLFLVDLCNSSRWPKSFEVSYREIHHQLGIKNAKTVQTQLKLLQDHNLLTFQPGTNQYRPTQISLVALDAADTPAATNVSQQSSSKVRARKEHASETPVKPGDPEVLKLNKLIKLYKLKKNKGELFLRLIKDYKKFLYDRLQISFAQEEKFASDFIEILDKLQSDAKQDAAARWQELFKNWSELNSFYSSQMNPDQINKNLYNLFNQIQNQPQDGNTAQHKRLILKRKNFKF